MNRIRCHSYIICLENITQSYQQLVHLVLLACHVCVLALQSIFHRVLSTVVKAIHECDRIRFDSSIYSDHLELYA